MRRLLVSVAVLGVVAVGASSAFAATSVAFHAPARVGADSLVVFSGRVGGSDRGVVVQWRAGRRWLRLVAGRSNPQGRFVLTWPAPPRAERLLVRAAAVGPRAVSAARVVVVRPLPTGAQPVVVGPRTQVLSPSVVSSVPAPGQAGTLVYSGGNQAQAGQIVAIGVGPATPDGFLGRVTAVQDRAGQTLISTVPATLLQAVPDGSVDLIGQSSGATVARVPPSAHPAATIACEGSGGVTITHSISFNTGLELKGSWSFFHGLQSASLTANASANASVKAVEQAAGSCALDRTAILHVPGPSVDTFVGPVPVVLTSELTVYLDASASAKASVTESASAGFSASAGIGWKKRGGFYPIGNLTTHFGYNPPSVSANADAEVNLTPTIDVLLYGVAGPRIALKAGLAFNADISRNPWWTLTAPLDLTASLAIPPLNLSSPILHIYQHTFPIADAGGPFGSPAAPASVSVTAPGNQSGSVGTPVSLQIQASDTDGQPITYSASGLPPGLSIDQTTGSITGMPTASGSYPVTVTATDASGPAGSTAFNWSISAGQALHISSYTPTTDLGCTLTTTEDSADEFYNDGATNDACGTFLVVAGTTYGPATVPAGGNLTTQSSYSAWTPVAQTTSGDGSQGSPYTTVTTVAAGTTGVQLTETDTWTLGGASVRSDMAVSGADGDTEAVQLYRAADCYTVGSDFGTGSYDPSTQTVACLHDNGNGTQTAEELIPITSSATSVEDLYSNVWSDLASQAPLPDSCQCADNIDNGLATAWTLTLSGATPITASAQFAFAFVPTPSGGATGQHRSGRATAQSTAKYSTGRAGRSPTKSPIHAESLVESPFARI